MGYFFDNLQHNRVCTGDVLTTVLSLYMYDGGLLPTTSEVLVCSGITKLEEVISVDDMMLSYYGYIIFSIEDQKKYRSFGSFYYLVCNVIPYNLRILLRKCCPHLAC